MRPQLPLVNELCYVTLTIAELDKGLCVSLTFLGIIQVVSSGLLIRGVKTVSSDLNVNVVKLSFITVYPYQCLKSKGTDSFERPFNQTGV